MLKSPFTRPFAESRLMKHSFTCFVYTFVCFFAFSSNAEVAPTEQASNAERSPQTIRSRPNRPSPGVEWLETEKNLTREQRMALWLQLFDHNGNGKLDPEEIEEIARYRYAQREREAAVTRRQTVLEAERLRAESEQKAPSENSPENVHTEDQSESGE